MTNTRTSGGFTLIEILVVIVIVATVVSMVLLSIGLVGEDNELDTERKRLATLIETVQEEAMMQGREFGIEVMTSSYRFVEFDPLTRQWAEVPGDELYRLRYLPEGLEFELYVDEKRLRLEADPKQFDDPEKDSMSPGFERYTPHLFVFASGEASVYEIRLLRPQTGGQRIMQGNMLGQIEFADNEDT